MYIYLYTITFKL